MKAHWSWGLSAILALSACSPALNWRTVPVAQLAALLPCKPDYAERNIELAGTQRKLSMWGCEAGGALFAVSHMGTDAQASPEQVITAWQSAALRNLPGATAQPLPLSAPALKGQGALPATMLRAIGKRANGQAVQAQLAWLSRGADVYHLAVFAPELTPAMTESFFSELQWQ